MLLKPANDEGVAAASEPPLMIASHRPIAMRRAAYPKACVEAAQAVQIVSLGPCSP